MLDRKIVVKFGEDYRVTIPLRMIRELRAQQGDYLKVRVAKGGKDSIFYVQVPQVPPSRKYLQVKRAIPETIAEELEIKPGDEVELASLELVKRDRPTKIFSGDKIDLLAALPSCSHSGRPLMVDIFTRGGEEWMRVWYSAGQGGKPRGVDIKRYLPLNRATGEFFGLLQAEARKDGNSFDFTNTIVEEHARLVNFVNTLVKEIKWSVNVLYNARLPIEAARQNLEHFLEIVKISPRKVLFIKHWTVSSYAFTVRIANAALVVALMGTLKAIRSKAAEIARSGKLTAELKEFCEGFILKDLLGDGTVSLQLARGRRKSRVMCIAINEVNEASQAEITSILSGLELKTTPCSKGKTNRIALRRDLEAYLWLLGNGAFRGHIRNRGKFLASFYDNHSTKSLLRLSKFNGKPVTTLQFAQMIGISTDAAHMYLLRHVRRGHLHLLLGESRKSNGYTLTREGMTLVRALEEGLAELRGIMMLYNVKNTDELYHKIVRSRHQNALSLSNTHRH